MSMFDLAGRVALVTGASRGIGRSIAVALAKQGAFVGINYLRGAEAAEQTLAEVRAAGGDGELVPFDVADLEATGTAVEAFAAKHKGLHIAVANAGIAIDGLLLRLREEDLDKTLRTNVYGALGLAKAAIRGMLRQRFGRVIFLSSVVGEAGNIGQVAYAASKGALLSAARSLAKEYASRNITVNAVTPGFIETEMTAGVSEEMRRVILGATPLARLGKPEEVAAACVYLASNEASFVTGQTLRVNGGLYV